MEYVHVVPNSYRPDTEKAIGGIASNCLYSLISGFCQSEFGYDTLLEAAEEIRQYRSHYVEPLDRTLFVDSGGYSIIKGDIKPQDISKANGCYQKYLETESIKNIFEFIFSFDIPINLKYPAFNTKENLYRFNYESLRDSKEILIRHPEIREKFYFVWQFKMPEQYQIWKRLYDELNLGEIILHRAIGGMVSMKSIANIDFSPFIALAYRCLNDYLKAGNYNHEFRLHHLGINLRHDRFFISYLEKLFARYLNDESSVIMTYDSINYFTAAQLNFKTMDVFDFNDSDDLKYFKGVVSLPSEIIRKIHVTDRQYIEIEAEIEAVKNKKRLKNLDAFSVLNIYSNLALDRFFTYVIEKYELVDLVFRHRNIIGLKYELRNILDKLSTEYPEVFNKTMVVTIICNVEITFKFHRWFTDRRDCGTLEQLTEAFIEMIDFPRLIK